MINVINSTVHLFALHGQLFNNICLLKLSALFLNLFVLLALRSHSRTLPGVHSDLQFGRSCSPSQAHIFILQQLCGHARLLGCHAAFGSYLEFHCGNRDRTAPKIHAPTIWVEINIHWLFTSGLWFTIELFWVCLGQWCCSGHCFISCAIKSCKPVQYAIFHPLHGVWDSLDLKQTKMKALLFVFIVWKWNGYNKCVILLATFLSCPTNTCHFCSTISLRISQHFTNGELSPTALGGRQGSSSQF